MEGTVTFIIIPGCMPSGTMTGMGYPPVAGDGGIMVCRPGPRMEGTWTGRVI